MAIDNLRDALVDELKDLLSAEKQISKALPKLAKNANDAKLRAAFEEHLEQTNKQISRLEQVFEKLEVPARAKKCEGIAGILEEGEEYLKKDKNMDPAVHDALLIAAAQKVEHYEIASYGTACAWAEQVGEKEIKKLLGETLSEERKTDEKLTQLAGKVNPHATAE